MNKEFKVFAGIIIIVAVLLGVGIYLVNKSGNSNTTVSQSDQGKLVRDDSHQTNQGAKVALVEFGDYQCPACGAAYPIIKQIQNQFKDNKNFNFVFRNFPLPMHPNAPMAAEAAEAAGAQGKYWEMHDKLYETQNDWSGLQNPSDIFAGYAAAIGLDVNKFKQDLQNNAYASKIQSDQNDGNALGVNATPTFYVNGKQFVGASQQALVNEIQQDLK